MNAVKRREQLAALLTGASGALSGSALAKELGVSRQVIVGDIAVLRGEGFNIISTTKGYVLADSLVCSRVLKLQHSDEDVKTELETVINAGGSVKNVFVNHKMYGRLSAPMNIATHRQIADYLDDIRYGKSAPLKNVTSGYHYHTVLAESEAVLDEIEKQLRQLGFVVE